MDFDGRTVPQELARDGYVFFVRIPGEVKFRLRSGWFGTIPEMEEYLTPLETWLRSLSLSTQRFVGEIRDGRLVQAHPIEYLEWGHAWVKGYSSILPSGEEIDWELALPPVVSAQS